MYFSDALRAIARRWWIALIGLVLVAGGGFAAMNLVATQYQASGQVLLLPPTAPYRYEDKVNPYLNLPDGLILTASLVAGSVATKDTARTLAMDGFDSPYVVAVVPGTGPTISVTVKDSDPEQVLRMRDELFKVVEAQLAALQAREGVSELHSIGLRYFSVGSEAEALAGARMRAVVLVGVLGAVLTLLVIFSVDKASRRPSSLLEPERDLAIRSAGAVAPPEPVRTLRRSAGIWPPPPAGPGPHLLERGDPLPGDNFGVWGRAN